MSWEDTLESAVGTVRKNRVRRGNATLVVQVSERSAGRVEELEGALARAALLHPQALTVVVLPKVGARLGEQVGHFAETHLSALAWALVGRDGSYRVRVPAWALDASHRPVTRPAKSSERLAPRFTEADRFLFKLLLFRGEAGAGLWHRPKSAETHYGSGADLARASGLTPSIVHRFLKSFEAEGFLRFDAQGYGVARAPMLLRQWLDLEAAKPRRRFGFRSPRGEAPNDGWFDRLPNDSRVAVGGFEACRRRGWLHVRGVSTWEVHVPYPRDVKRLAESWGLVEATSDRAALFVVQPPPPRTRGTDHHKLPGAVGLWECLEEGRVPSVDALEAAFDCVAHPARGREQAEFLVERILRAVS